MQGKTTTKLHNLKSIKLERSRRSKKDVNDNTQNRINNDITFKLKSILLSENYIPSVSTRTTTNFANLARGTNRKENLRNTIRMINNRFNS